MVSRRQVRQAAVQLLYAQASSPKDQGGADFWELVNDHTSLTYDRARVKILAHLQQGREATTKKLQQLLIESSASILACDPSEKLAREFKAMAAAEFEWAEKCGNLLRLTKANTGGWRRDLHQLLPAADKLQKNRTGFLLNLESFPPLEKKNLKENLNKLENYDARVRMVRFPGKFPDQRELDHLHQLTKEMAELAREAGELAGKVEADLPAVDEAIDSASTNFDLGRLAKVELAILRLATWEILKLPDLDAAVSITEAVDLARSFSSEESASFVNGVLDHIAKAKA